HQRPDAQLPATTLDLPDVVELEVDESARHGELPRVQRMAGGAPVVRGLETHAVVREADLHPHLALRADLRLEVRVAQVIRLQPGPGFGPERGKGRELVERARLQARLPDRRAQA